MPTIVTVSASSASRLPVACSDKETAVPGEAVGAGAQREIGQLSRVGLGVIPTQLLTNQL